MHNYNKDNEAVRRTAINWRTRSILHFGQPSPIPHGRPLGAIGLHWTPTLAFAKYQIWHLQKCFDFGSCKSHCNCFPFRAPFAHAKIKTLSMLFWLPNIFFTINKNRKTPMWKDSKLWCKNNAFPENLSNAGKKTFESPKWTEKRNLLPLVSDHLSLF